VTRPATWTSPRPSRRTRQQPQRNLRELWRRLVFGIVIRNTDDHLRNHGFLRAYTAGRRFPRPRRQPGPRARPGALATSIDGRADEARLDVALAVAELFRLADRDAEACAMSLLQRPRGAPSQSTSRCLTERSTVWLGAFEHDQLVYAQTV